MGTKAEAGAQGRAQPGGQALKMLALLVGNAALALGPWWVRLSDSGPVSAGFWRLALALPVFVLLARANRQPLLGLGRGAMLAVLGAGLFFALDIASWHIGIERTRLANATLFGNSGSVLVMAWGLFALRRAPRPREALAFLAALAGGAILMGRSLEIDARSFAGDLFCLLAGFLYTFYILLLQRTRATLGNWSLLTWSSLAGLPVLLGVAIMLDEPVWPQTWWPVIGLAVGSQVLGQGLLVWSLRHFPPLVIGLALLTQPVVAVLAGWLSFGEVPGVLDFAGMALVAAALALARSRTAD